MVEKTFFVDAWPTGKSWEGTFDEVRHKTWCKCLRKAVSASRAEGFELTHEMQERMKVSVDVTLHAGRNGASCARDVDVYHDCLELSLFDAHITDSMDLIDKIRISAERKSGPKKLGGTTVHVVWR